MSGSKRGLPAGVQRKHSRRCPAHPDNENGRCRGKGCKYQVQAGPRGARKTKTCATLDEALAWKRAQERAAGRAGRGRAPTLRVADEMWRVDAKTGVALARGRKRFKPGTLHDYYRILDVDLLPEYGNVRLDELGDRLDGLVTDLQRRGLAASTVRNILMPLRAIYRHAIRMKWVTVNPTLGLEVPTGSGRRMRIVPAGEIRKYLMALPVADRALWATAFYAGLRRGELMALRWSDVDLAAGFIVIDEDVGAYDPKTKTTGGPKSAAGVRKIPICGELRDYLLEHRARAGARPTGLVFARGSLAGSCRRGTEDGPFNDSTIDARARNGLPAKKGEKATNGWTHAGLIPMTLHDARHTFASMMIEAMAQRGVFNPKLLQQIMGHSSIQVTYDRYGKLFPGAEAEVGVMLDELIGGQHAAVPAVAEAWSRLQRALEDAEPEHARPVVTYAVDVLSSWQRTHACEASLPSTDVTVATRGDRAANVQRGLGRQEP